MGCFDFTYADNGQNIRGRKGFIYITNDLKQAINIKSPIAFSSTDEYGRFDCYIKHTTLTLDIYAIIAIQMYLHTPNMVSKPEACQKLIDVLKSEPKNWSFTEIEQLCNQIRENGIDYDFAGVMNCTNTPFTIHVPKIGNQQEKTCQCEHMVSKHIPLLITRKRLPDTDKKDLIDIASDWGYVTGNDPNQGWAPTKNLYYRFIHPDLLYH